MHQGSCLCKGVTFTVAGELPPIQVCHCSQCRHAQGTPFATNIPVAEVQVTWLSGVELIHYYESSPGKFRCFCKTCGSPLFSKRASLPGILRMRAGTFDGDLLSRVGVHIYHGSKAHWWTGLDDAPKFDEMPPV
ncbi:MAG: GFA family protein [Burkholderiales bacterium]|nr:GFA family protein [Burkholderiales bacterium]